MLARIRPLISAFALGMSTENANLRVRTLIGAFALGIITANANLRASER